MSPTRTTAAAAAAGGKSQQEEEAGQGTTAAAAGGGLDEDDDVSEKRVSVSLTPPPAVSPVSPGSCSQAHLSQLYGVWSGDMK